MRAVHYLIDCEGKLLLSPFPALRQALTQDLGEHDLITYAVEKLGYIHVQEWSRGLVVFYRRPLTTPVTLAGAIYLLTDLGDKRVIFSIAGRRATYSMCRGRSQAVGRLAREMRDLEKAWQSDHTIRTIGPDVGPQPFAAKARKSNTT